MKNLISKSFILLISASLFLACTANDPLQNITDDNTRVYISNYDKKIDYKNYLTYFKPDTVFVNNNNQVRISSRSSNGTFLNLFKNEFEKKGFKFVKKTQNPDLGIAISRVSNAKIGLESPVIQYFNNYWGYNKFGETGFKYPGYFTNYEIKDVIWNIEVVDLLNAKENGELAVVWNAQIRGNGVFDEDNFSLIIEKVFEISEFLDGKK